MKILKYFKTPYLKYFMKLLIFNIKWLKTFKNMIKVYQVSRRYIMLFMHNNKYLPLTSLLTCTLLQWTVHITACIDLHPAKYFDIYGVKWLEQATKQVGLQLGSCSMHKWMKNNVWRIKMLKPKKTSWNFWNISGQKISWNFTSLGARCKANYFIPHWNKSSHLLIRRFKPETQYHVLTVAVSSGTASVYHIVDQCIVQRTMYK